MVIAAGSLEQPAVFRHNDLPGVMMGSAAQRLIRHYGIRPGRRAVVLTANSDGYGVALDLADAGVQLQAVVDLRSDTGTSETVSAINELGVPILTGCTVSEMMHSHGKHHITAALISRITGEGTCEKAARTVECDLLCMSVRLHADLAPAAPSQRQVRLQQIDGDVRGGLAAAARHCSRLGRRNLQSRRRDPGRPPRRLAGGAGCGP